LVTSVAFVSVLVAVAVLAVAVVLVHAAVVRRRDGKTPRKAPRMRLTWHHGL
jgi:hypothetical protein